MTTLTREFCLTSTADTINVKIETVFAEAFQSDALDSRHNLRGGNLRHNLRGGNLCHLPTSRADLMTMVIIAIESLVFRDSLNVMTHYQTDIPEEVERIVKRRPTDRESIFLFQFDFKFI